MAYDGSSMDIMREFCTKWWKRIATVDMLFIAVLTLIASLIGSWLKQYPGFKLFGALIIALLIGMIIQFPIRKWYVGASDKRKAGVKDAAGLISNKLLRLGIILLGFKLNLQMLFTQGIKCLPIAVVVVTLTIVVTYWVARKMGVDPMLAILTAGGTGICGACPLPASSGRTNRHRLNKGGNRQGDMALRRIAIVRLRYHQPTRDHAAGKTREGEGRLENIRCVKRFIAREACRVLIAIRNGGIGRRMPAERGAGLREPRVGHGITHSRSTRRHACRSAASERSNEANGTCPNSSDGPSNGFTPSPVQNNTPKRLTMYRSIKTHGTPKFT